MGSPLVATDPKLVFGEKALLLLFTLYAVSFLMSLCRIEGLELPGPHLLAAMLPCKSSTVTNHAQLLLHLQWVMAQQTHGKLKCEKVTMHHTRPACGMCGF